MFNRFGITDSKVEFFYPACSLRPYILGYKFIDGFQKFAGKNIFVFSTGFPELIFQYQDNSMFHLSIPGSNPSYRIAYIIKPYEIRTPHWVRFGMRLKMMSVMFSFHGLSRVFDISLNDTSKHFIDLSDLLGNEARELTDAICYAQTNRERVYIIKSFLKDCCRKELNIDLKIANCINYLTAVVLRAMLSVEIILSEIVSLILEKRPCLR